MITDQDRLEQLEAAFAQNLAVQIETLKALQVVSDTLSGFMDGFATRQLRIIDDDGNVVALIENRNGRGVLSLAGAAGQVVTIGDA